jgi:hypothetical protein
MIRSSRGIVISMLAFVLFSAGCSKDAAQSAATEGVTTGAGMEIGFSTENAPISGNNTFEVTVKKDGAPVEDASVNAAFTMPAMPSMNMPEMHGSAALQPAGSGRYRGSGQLSMAGTWNVRVTVTRNGQELGTKTLSIVAK